MIVDFSGLWKADLLKSRYLSPPPKAITIKIDHSDPVLEETIAIENGDGSIETATFRCITNGEPDTSLLNGKPIHGNATWQGDELIIESWTQFGALKSHFRDCWSLSPDGRTLSMEHRDDDLAGQKVILQRLFSN